MTTTIHDNLDQLRSHAHDDRAKGDRFERLMVAYLKTDPTYQQLYSDVWKWSDSPERNGCKDPGIETVAQFRDTEAMTAIQRKFYAPNHPLNKPNIGSFLSASSKDEFSARLNISTTDNWGPNAEEAREFTRGSRSTIDSIIERYQVNPDKASGIANDPNDWATESGNPRNILDLLARIVTVSVEAVRIVKSLPPLDVTP